MVVEILAYMCNYIICAHYIVIYIYIIYITSDTRRGGVECIYNMMCVYTVHEQLEWHLL